MVKQISRHARVGLKQGYLLGQALELIVLGMNQLLEVEDLVLRHNPIGAKGWRLEGSHIGGVGLGHISSRMNFLVHDHHDPFAPRLVSKGGDNGRPQIG